MERTSIVPQGFAKPLGAYSHALKVDIGTANMIFVTGQLAMDADGNAVHPEDPAAQTEYIFENIQKILSEAGADITDVVKVQIFVTNINDFAEISKVRNKYFEASRPASTLVEISKTVKEGCTVEIEVMAIKAK